MIKLPLGINRASEETVKALVAIRALYMDEKGIHASKSGIYPEKEKYPCQRPLNHRRDGKDNKNSISMSKLT